MRIFALLPFCFSICLLPVSSFATERDSLATYFSQKTYPPSLESVLLEALSYYPEFKDLPIAFEYSEQISTALMEAQPDVNSLFRARKHRKYTVFMTPALMVDGVPTSINKLPHDVLLGWFVHELGHIKDYEKRSTWGMIWFGIAYYFSADYKISAERQADLYAISKGCGKYLIATKNFILSSADLPAFYKRKIRSLYMSPEEVAQIIEDELELEEVEEYNREEK